MAIAVENAAPASRTCRLEIASSMGLSVISFSCRIQRARRWFRIGTRCGAPSRRSSFQSAGRGVVIEIGGQAVRLPQDGGQLLVVLAQFGQHILRRDEVGVIIKKALEAPI